MEQGTALGIPGGETAIAHHQRRFHAHNGSSPASFPLPNVNDVVPCSPGLCGSPHYPGFRPHRVPYPARGCAVRARRGGAILKGGMGWGSLVQMKSPPGGNVQYLHNPQTPHALRSAVRHNRLRGCGPLAAHTRGNAWDGATPGFMAQHLRCREGRTPDERGWGDRLEIPIRESQRRCAAASHLWQNPVGIPGRIVRPSPRPTGCDGLGLCFVLSSKGAAVLTPPRLYICSRVSMPRTSRPCFRTRAVKSQIARRLARDSGSALRTWQFS